MENSKTKPYICKHCGENNQENFYEKRYTSCKKCLNIQKSKSRDKSEKQKKYEDIIPYDKDLDLKIEKFFNTNYRVFGGLTTIQVIEEQRQIIDSLKKEVESLTKEVKELRSDTVGNKNGNKKNNNEIIHLKTFIEKSLNIEIPSPIINTK